MGFTIAISVANTVNPVSAVKFNATISRYPLHHASIQSRMEKTDSPFCPLVGSAGAYYSLYRLRLPTDADFLQIAKRREVISIFHCSLQTILSVACLRHHANSLRPLQASDGDGRVPSDSECPIITTRSAFANTITAIETGYLLQDSVVLLHAHYRRRHSRSHTNLQQLKGWNVLHLGLHHSILGALLLILQLYIARGREKGILVIVALHLLNASSIPGTARWFLRNFQPHRKRLIEAMTMIYLASFAVCRVYLIYWILEVFAKQQAIPTWTAMMRLRGSCMIGTGTIAAVNTAWLAMGVRNLVRQSNALRRKDKAC